MNSNWFIPVVVGGGALAFVAFLGFVFALLFGVFRGSEAYVHALAQARSNSAVVQALGEPIEVGWWVSGTIKSEGPSGSADISMPLRGPIGRGTLYVTGAKHADRWEYSVLEVAIEGKDERINLLGQRHGV